VTAICWIGGSCTTPIERPLGTQDLAPVPRQYSGQLQNQELTAMLRIVSLLQLLVMFSLLRLWIEALIRLFRSRRNLVLENLDVGTSRSDSTYASGQNHG